MIKGIAFDLEGTLIDVELAHHRAHVAIAEELGLRLTMEEAIVTIPSFVGGPDIEVLREIAEKTAFPGPLSDLLQRKKTYYQQFLDSMEIRPRSGVVPVLQQIQAFRLPMAIGSVTPRAEGLKLLRAASLNIYFNERALVMAEDVTAMKPNPDVYIKTAACMRIFPSEQLVFEDSPQGVRAAVAASSLVIAVPTVDSKSFADSLVAAGAWRVMGSWDEVDILSMQSELSE